MEGTTGFLAQEQFKGKVLTADIKNSFASVIATSVDALPLTKSRHIYLVMAGPRKMSGLKYNRSRNGLSGLGVLPIITQVVKGSIILKLAGESATLRYLKSDGSIIKSEKVKLIKGELNIDPARKISPVLEILVH